NTRASYPITYIDNARIPCVGPHPRNVVLLCCDAFGVLPPVSKLTLEQAMYHFISGYTSKVAGTEMGVTEPEATFSACYGGAFLVWHPMKYAAQLAERMQKHGTKAWLVNTGWTGGSYGVGRRMSLKHTRAIIDAIHAGELDDAAFETLPIFGLQVPTECHGLPHEELQPHEAWGDDEAYSGTLTHLARLFVDAFKQYLAVSAAPWGLRGGARAPSARRSAWRERGGGEASTLQPLSQPSPFPNSQAPKPAAKRPQNLPNPPENRPEKNAPGRGRARRPRSGGAHPGGRPRPRPAGGARGQVGAAPLLGRFSRLLLRFEN
ncbi:MAG: phosphoenolpyruvate carboxykinase-domain-containing protein, partial [Monoraphidium minutum]